MSITALIVLLTAAALGTVFMGRETDDRGWFLGTFILGLAAAILLWLRLLAA